MQAQPSRRFWTALPCPLKLDHEGIGETFLLDVASIGAFASECRGTRGGRQTCHQVTPRQRGDYHAEEAVGPR